jgi:hypothetical protein
MKALLLLLTATVCLAQDEPKKPEPAKYYRVDFVVKESEGGRTVNSRNYGMTVAAGKGVIRTGDRVPVTSNTKEGSVTFIDVGVNIDWSIDFPVQDQVRMHISADISSVAPDKPGLLPLINSTRCTSDLIVPLRKATNIFSADGATTKRQTQMDVTVTPI